MQLKDGAAPKITTVGTRIFWACATLVALTMVVGAVSLHSFFDLSSKLNWMLDRVLPGVYSMGTIRTTTKDMRECMLLHATSDSDAERAALESEIAKYDQKIRNEMKAYRARMYDPKDRVVFAHIEAAYDAFNQAWELRVRPLGRAGQSQEAIAAYRSQLIPLREVLAKELDQGVALNRIISQKSAREASQSSHEGYFPILAIMGFSIMSGAALTFTVKRGINVALRRSVQELRAAVAAVNQIADQVASSSESVADGAARQADTLAATYAACDMLGADAEEATDKLRHVAERASELQAALAGAASTSAGQPTPTLQGAIERAGSIKELLDAVGVAGRDRDQASGVVTANLSEIEQVTKSSAHEAEQCAAAGKELSGQTESLMGIVFRLGSLVGGPDADRRKSVRPDGDGSGLREPRELAALQGALGPSTSPELIGQTISGAKK